MPASISKMEEREMSEQGKVEINKVELLDGEELQTLVKKVVDAITQGKGKTNKSLFLNGIFKDHVITRDWETGKFFKMEMARDGDAITLTGSAEVRQAFVPVGQKVEKAEDQLSCTVAISSEKVGEEATVIVVKADAKTVADLLADAISDEAPNFQDVAKESIWGGIL